MTPSYLRKISLVNGAYCLEISIITIMKYQSWNNIDINFQSTPSFGTFKKNIFSLIRLISKSTFGIHDPIQLRVGVSPLRHKTIHNFLNTPNDWCHCLCAPEDTKHFLLHCHLYK